MIDLATLHARIEEHALPSAVADLIEAVAARVTAGEMDRPDLVEKHLAGEAAALEAFIEDRA